MRKQSYRETLWNEIQLKGPKTQKQTQEQNKQEWASSVGLCPRPEPHHPHNVKVSPWGLLAARMAPTPPAKRWVPSFLSMCICVMLVVWKRGFSLTICILFCIHLDLQKAFYSNFYVFWFSVNDFCCTQQEGVCTVVPQTRTVRCPSGPDPNPHPKPDGSGLTTA